MDQRPTPHEKKTGARNRKITDRARRGKGGKKSILFHGTVCAYLTCRLMGDPLFLFCPSQMAKMDKEEVDRDWAIFFTRKTGSLFLVKRS